VPWLHWTHYLNRPNHAVLKYCRQLPFLLWPVQETLEKHILYLPVFAFAKISCCDNESVINCFQFLIMKIFSIGFIIPRLLPSVLSLNIACFHKRHGLITNKTQCFRPASRFCNETFQIKMFLDHATLKINFSISCL